MFDSGPVSRVVEYIKDDGCKRPVYLTGSLGYVSYNSRVCTATPLYTCIHQASLRYLFTMCTPNQISIAPIPPTLLRRIRRLRPILQATALHIHRLTHNYPTQHSRASFSHWTHHNRSSSRFSTPSKAPQCRDISHNSSEKLLNRIQNDLDRRINNAAVVCKADHRNCDQKDANREEGKYLETAVFESDLVKYSSDRIG